MPIAEINGIKLYYEDYGSGFPVVFLHGFAGTTQMWKPQVPVLSKKYRFITYDARGHGQSQSPSSPDLYSVDIVVEDLHQLLRSLSLPRVVLGGLSVGGYQSLRFYLEHPEEVASLILMCTGPGFRNPTRMAEWNSQQETRARFLETEGIVAFADKPEIRTAYSYTPREVMIQHNPAGLANMFRKVVTQHDSNVIEKLGEIKVPTLLIFGENDFPQFLAAADYMSKAIPGSRRVTIPHAGHAVNQDNADAFNQAVLSFLTELNLT